MQAMVPSVIIYTVPMTSCDQVTLLWFIHTRVCANANKLSREQNPVKPYQYYDNIMFIMNRMNMNMYRWCIYKKINSTQLISIFHDYKSYHFLSFSFWLVFWDAKNVYHVTTAAMLTNQALKSADHARLVNIIAVLILNISSSLWLILILDRTPVQCRSKWWLLACFGVATRCNLSVLEGQFQNRKSRATTIWAL